MNTIKSKPTMPAAESEAGMVYKLFDCNILYIDLMQYILTSATLGAEDDNEGVAEFARNLCCSPFSSEDIVRASRIIPKKPAECCQLTTTFYRNIAELLNHDASDEKLLCELRKYNS